MAFIARITGQVRAIRDVTKKDSGELFARNVSVLTQHGEHLGETVRVTVWDREHSRVSFEPGQDVDLVVEVRTSERYGVECTLKEALAAPAPGFMSSAAA